MHHGEQALLATKKKLGLRRLMQLARSNLTLAETPTMRI